MNVNNHTLPDGYDVDDIEAIVVICDGSEVCNKGGCERILSQPLNCPLCQTMYQMSDGVQSWLSPTEH